MLSGTGSPVEDELFLAGDTIASASETSPEVQLLDPIQMYGHTGYKPQSKVWTHDNQWWTVFADLSGTGVWRLDGDAWTKVLNLASRTYNADVKPDGGLVHLLLEKHTNTLFSTLEYVPGAPGTYRHWTVQPSVISLPLSSGTETATLDKDSTGRLWVAFDTASDIRVIHSAAPYTSWSAPIVVANGVQSDDISAVTALPNNQIGVMWSNQTTQRFGFRIHDDATSPGQWSADEVPASQSALAIGGGMADDHLNIAVTSDGTLFAAVKTSYDTAGFAKIALLVRRPDGQWDDLYEVDTEGTRAIVEVSEIQNRLLVVYRAEDSQGPIVYKESPLDAISFGPRTVLLDDTALSNPSGIKDPFENEIVVVASGNNTLVGARLTYPTASNLAPFVNAGADQSVSLEVGATLDGTVIDDGLPNPPAAVTRAWTMVSGPGVVTFADASAVDTTASFSVAGSYLLRLSADDGALVGSDDVEIVVTAPPLNQAPVVSAGADQSVSLAVGATLDGVVSDDGLPNPPGAVITDWSVVSGPGVVTFADASAIDTTAVFSVAGTYVLRLSADDGALVSGDDVQIVVTPPVNQAPVVNAGADQSVSVAVVATLDGTITDDGLPNPPGALTTAWTMVSGPGVVTFANASAVDTTASFSVSGVYVLRLSASDAELTGADDVAVNVTDDAPLVQTFQNGVSSYEGTSDTRIRDSDPNTNYGSVSTMLVDATPPSGALIRWDIAAIPPGSIIVGATMTFTVSGEDSADAFEVYEVLRPWVEDEATWNVASAGVPWGQPGATAATDRGAAVLGLVTGTKTGPTDTHLNADGLAVVQTWVNDPASNHGFIIQNYATAGDSLGLRSSEYRTENRPILAISYFPPSGTQATATNISLAAKTAGSIEPNLADQSMPLAGRWHTDPAPPTLSAPPSASPLYVQLAVFPKREPTKTPPAKETPHSSTSIAHARNWTVLPSARRTLVDELLANEDLLPRPSLARLNFLRR